MIANRPPLEHWPLRFVETNRSRHGTARFYFRKSGAGRLRLPDPYADPDTFQRVYDQCIESIEAVAPMVEGTRRKKRNPLFRALHQAAYRAKRKHRSFDLTPGWVLEQLARQDGRCAITGIAMMPFETGIASPYQISIDRADNRLGYTKNNCRLVILAVNIALNQWGLDTFMEIVQATISRTKLPHLAEGQQPDGVLNCHT